MLRNLLAIICPAISWCVLRLDMGGDSSPAPAPDPNIGDAAKVNAETGREMVKLGREQFDDYKARADRIEPFLTEQMGLQNAVAKDNQARSSAQWDDYVKTYRPIEQRMASDASSWDSAENLDRAAQQAGADVAKGYSGARASAMRDLARSGVNPNSGRFAATAATLGLAEAKDTAGAMNTARDTRKLQGVSMRENVAKFGRNMPSTGIAADQLALSGAAGAASGANNALLTRAQAQNSALPWMTGGVSATNAAGNLALGQYQTQVNAWGQQQQADAQSNAGFGQLLGTGLGLGAKYLMSSSEEVKEDKVPVQGELILAGLDSIPVEAWKYKEGEGDGGEHIGPYAEDMQEQFGDGVAPGGKAIDLVSMNGITLAAIKELSKKVKRIESEMGLGDERVRRVA